MKYLRCVAVMFLFAAFVPAPSRAQAKNAPPMPAPDYATKYDRSPAGMLVQFQLIMTNAKNPDRAKLFIDELEIPKYDDYFHTVYQSDVELFWTGSYTRALVRAEADFQSLFARLGMQEGEFNIRKVNDAPMSKLEEALTSKMKGPVDVYAVSWKKRNAPDNSAEDLLGYYAYVGGRFRWLYMLNYPKTPDAAPKTAAKPAGGSPKAAASGSGGSAAQKSNSSSSAPQSSSHQ
ncbi:MAG TPA: hypothetical protein VNY09_07205 [Candidatus Sulfotelmatobacter sp.]|nr:hypothetical protein [Candidatus Sulfotelmatobacter sp.]